jgi:hypothetical protein
MALTAQVEPLGLGRITGFRYRDRKLRKSCLYGRDMVLPRSMAALAADAVVRCLWTVAIRGRREPGHVAIQTIAQIVGGDGLTEQ